MILLVHQNGETISRVLNKDKELKLKQTRCAEAFWEVAEKYPEELICWVEESLLKDLNFEKLEQLFQHDLIMASYAVKTKFLPESIGYIDQLPFINISPAVRYPTWRMSSDVGGIPGETLLRFKEVFYKEKRFDHLLNSIAKLGQQNGLFCYSDPALVNQESSVSPEPSATTDELFSFVYEHYNSVWTLVLFWCLWHYEGEFNLWALFSSFFSRKHFKKEIDLSGIEKVAVKTDISSESIDVSFRPLAVLSICYRSFRISVHRLTCRNGWLSSSRILILLRSQISAN